MDILTVSDKEEHAIYSQNIKQRFGDVVLALSCGDLPYYYLEYIISSLDIPLYYVLGNHAKPIEFGLSTPRKFPWGGINLHKKVVHDPKTGLLLAGIEGSLLYNEGPHQYTQAEMWAMVFSLVPALIVNKLHYGRYLDIFITHAPPWRIHDADDPAHQGAKAFNWLIDTFKPTYHIHGHIHVYSSTVETETKVGDTIVLNTYGYRQLTVPGVTELQTVQ